MKEKTIIAVILSFLFLLPLSAQKREGGFDVEKHRKEQADFFTKELNLTAKEQKEFIPLMQEYLKARYELNREVRNAGRDLKRKGTNTTSADYQRAIDLMLDQKIKEAKLQKEYFKKFGTVLPAKKVFKYQAAEIRFMERAVKDHQKEERGKR